MSLLEEARICAFVFLCFFFLGVFFGVVLFLKIWRHPPIISGHLAASRQRLASRTIISGQFMRPRQSFGLSGFKGFRVLEL